MVANVQEVYWLNGVPRIVQGELLAEKKLLKEYGTVVGNTDY